MVTALSHPTIVQLLPIQCTRIDYNFYHCIVCMTLYLCTFVLLSRNKAIRGRTARVQGRVSRWNKLRSSTKGLFSSPSLHWPFGGAIVRAQGPVLTVRECWSTCLSNLWLAHVPTLCNDTAPTQNTINTWARRAQGFIVILVSTRSASPRSRSRDLRLGPPSCPPSLGSGWILSMIFQS